MINNGRNWNRLRGRMSKIELTYQEPTEDVHFLRVERSKDTTLRATGY